MDASESFDIFDTLTSLKPSSKAYEATELIGSLVKVVGYHVCSTSYQRNTQSSYLFLSSARDTWQRINDLIAQVETEAKWESYDEYIGLIDPLEGALLKFSSIAEKELDQYVPDSSATTVKSFLDFIDAWKTNRDELHEALSLLMRQTGQILDTAAIQKHDNLIYLQTFHGIISKHPFIHISSRAKRHRLVSSVVDSLTVIRDKLAQDDSSDDCIVMSIRCAIAITGIMNVAVNKDSDPQLQAYLKDVVVWKAAQAVLAAISKHLLRTSDSGIEKINARWEEFKELLLKIGGAELPQSFHELIKLVANIRRPYLRQSIELVSACHRLHEHFNVASNRTPSAVDLFEKAIDQTNAALAEAKTRVPSLMIELTSEEKATVDQTFTDAESKIKECFISYQLQMAWKEWENKILQARAKDELHMSEFRKRQKPYADIKSERLVFVNVTVVDSQNSSENVSVRYSVAPQTTLDALLWKESSRLSESQTRLMTRSHFKVANTIHPFSSTVESLLGGRESLELVLEIVDKA